MEMSSSPSASRKPNKRTRRSNGSRLWSRDIPDYDNFTPSDYSCRICKQVIKKELLAHAKTWWERQLILMAMVFSGYKPKEVARKEYQALMRNCKKGYMMGVQGGSFYICRDHLAFVGERWLDFLCIQSPEDVMNAKETAVREAMDLMQFFNDRDVKFKSERAFLEHCDQFISNEWHEILKLFPTREDVIHQTEMENESIESDQEGPSDRYGARDVYGNERNKEDEEDVETQISSKSPVLKPVLVEGVCNVCGEHVTTGLVLTTDWNRRIILYMAHKKKLMKRERCRRLFLQKERLLTCFEHAKQSVEEIFTIFGTREQSMFLTMYQSSHFTHYINRCFEDICRVFELWYETRSEWIRDVRVFVLTISSGEREGVVRPKEPSQRSRSIRSSRTNVCGKTRVRKMPSSSSDESQPCTSKSTEMSSKHAKQPRSSEQCSIPRKKSNRPCDMDWISEDSDSDEDNAEE